MNKLAEKVSAVMNGPELEQLITDHYTGEAQMLTSGAEENLLKLAELRGILTVEQAARWEQIKTDFRRNKQVGGSTGRYCQWCTGSASPYPAKEIMSAPELLSGTLGRLGPLLEQIAGKSQPASGLSLFWNR